MSAWCGWYDRILKRKGSKRLLGQGYSGTDYLHTINFSSMQDKILAANARYSAKVNALLQELAPLSHDLLNRKPADGGWSAMQTLHHLILVEENSRAYIRKKLGFNPKVEKSGFWTPLKMLLLRVTLRSPIKFSAPKSASAERIPDSADFAETQAQWQKIRADWTTFFETMPPELQDKAVYRHPRIGLINWLQMLDFLSEHFDRHRGQALRAVFGKF